ncbi:MAG: hypothetical protein IPH54_20500 [Rhodoferax sp.]|nr:hypothetical protein [Rhodoferax sp.]
MSALLNQLWPLALFMVLIALLVRLSQRKRRQEQVQRNTTSAGLVAWLIRPPPAMMWVASCAARTALRAAPGRHMVGRNALPDRSGYRQLCTNP